MRVPRRIVTALAAAAIAAATLLCHETGEKAGAAGFFSNARAGGPGGATQHPPAEDGQRTLVVFAIDTSGSLSPSDLARAGALAGSILRGFPRGAEAALFTFDDQARLAMRRTSRPEEIGTALGGLRRHGRHTALYDALYDAARYLRDADADRRALVLITDGRDEESAVDLADGLAVAQQAKIPVFTVGVGRVEERVLRRVAKLTGGQYEPLRSARPGLIAARVTAFEATPAPAATPRPAEADTARGAAEGGRRPPPGAETAADAPAPSSARPLIWIAATIALLLAGAAALRRRRRAAEAVIDDVPDDARAPTLLERMSSTEEYLEKTVTLRERPVLTITRGPGVGQVFELGTESALSIGRAKANEVVVNDVSVSSEHCRIRPEDGHFVLHDLKSTNGTFVNERRVTRHVLSEGDVVKIGETSLLFKTDLKRS